MTRFSNPPFLTKPARIRPTPRSLLAGSLALTMAISVNPLKASEPVVFKNFSEVTVSGEFDRRASAKNHALIIYNADYADTRIPDLPVTEKDARAMRKLFEEMGYPKDQITLVGNGGREDLEEAVLKFATSLDKESTAIVYYSGHGVTFEGDPENYILPADMRPDTRPGSKAIRRLQLSRRALPLGEMVDMIKTSGPRGLIVFYDACRNSPLADDDGAKAIGASAAFTPSRIEGTAIFYSARRGQTSLATLGPGDDVNLSLFTRVLVSKLSQSPAMRLRDLQVELQADVSAIARDRAHGHEQRPIMEDDLDYSRAQNREFCLASVSRDGAAQCGVAGPAPVVQTASLPPFLTAWQAIENSNNPGDFAEYLQKFPQSPFRALATLKLTPAAPEKPAQTPKPAVVKREPQPLPETKPRAGETPKLVKIGALMDQTGPIASLTPSMFKAVELAVDEANASPNFLGGARVQLIKGDSTCVKRDKVVAAARDMIGQGVRGIVGPDCSGASAAVIADLNGDDRMVLVSPSGTSPSLSDRADDGYFFRTSPSDHRDAEVSADFLWDQGHRKFAILTSDQGSYEREARVLESQLKAKGAAVQLRSFPSKGSWKEPLNAFDTTGDVTLILIGQTRHLDKEGLLEGALDTGRFDHIHLVSIIGYSTLFKRLGKRADGVTGVIQDNDKTGRKMHLAAMGNPKTLSSPYTDQSYDAAALILLAMQASGSTDPAKYRSYINDIANVTGPADTAIYPGELDKGFQLLGQGKPINYIGATGVELKPNGDALGIFREVSLNDGKTTTLGYR